MDEWMDGHTGKTILSAASGNCQVEKYKPLAVGNRELILHPPPPPRPNPTEQIQPCQTQLDAKYLPPATASTVDMFRPH